MERFDVSSREVLWYASFGDLNANECIGCIEPPTRSQPVHEVVSPHRKFKIGEDPVCFERSQIEYMDTSNDVLLKRIHQGEWVLAPDNEGSRNAALQVLLQSNTFTFAFRFSA